MSSISGIQSEFSTGFFTKPKQETETTGAIASNNDVDPTAQMDKKKQMEQPLLQFGSPETTGSVATGNALNIAA